MTRSTRLIPFAALALALATPLTAQRDWQSAVHDYRTVVVADGLENPWSIAFTPDGDMLITERPGRLRVVRNGQLLPNPVAGLPAVFTGGSQAGLLDVVAHPNFASNRLLYISYSKPLADNQSTTAIIRGRYENNRLSNVEELFEANSRGNGHYGSRIVFDGNGHFFFTVGDRQAPPRGDLEAHPAQDRSNHHGTVNRLNEDGSVPSDNPFVGQAGIEPSIWSYGHRNPQGLTINPNSGDIWATEHGPQGGDELNHIEAGQNYGWPVVGYGVNYGREGTAIHASTSRSGMTSPTHFWVPSIATSGLMYYTGDKFPGWQGSLFVGGMAGQQMARLVLDGQTVMMEETLLNGVGRVRDIRQGPDGYIYVAIEDRRGAPTPVLRLEPR